MQRKIITFDKIKFSSEAIKNGSPVYDEKNSAEYLKQLKAQEHGINKMMAVDWLKINLLLMNLEGKMTITQL